MMAVLNAIGIEGEQTAMVLAVDWFLDRLRTAVNVFSNAVGVAVIAQISKSRMVDKYSEEDIQNYESQGMSA